MKKYFLISHNFKGKILIHKIMFTKAESHLYAYILFEKLDINCAYKNVMSLGDLFWSYPFLSLYFYFKKF